MDVIEYQVRIESLVAAVAGREASIERVKSYVAAAISELKARLKRAKAKDRRELKLQFESAWVDDTVAGARRLNYRLGHDRSYEGSLKRLKKLQTERREEGGPPDDDPEDGIAPDETPAPEAGPVVETTEDGLEATGLGVGDSDDTDAGVAATNHSSAAPLTNDPVSPPTNEPLPPSAEPGAPSPIRPLGATKVNPFLQPRTSEWGLGLDGRIVRRCLEVSVAFHSAKDDSSGKSFPNGSQVRSLTIRVIDGCGWDARTRSGGCVLFPCKGGRGRGRRGAGTAPGVQSHR